MKVYIVAAKRTAIGSMNGTLKDIPSTELGAKVVKQLLEDTKIDPNHINEVIVGNVLSAGLGQGPGRQVAIKAGIPKDIPAYSLNMVCGSGMKSVMNAFAEIKSGQAEVIIAGGIENMSKAPHLLPANIRTGHKMGDITITDHMIYDSLTDAYSNVHMGITAENIALKHNITREMQDDFAYASQMKAIKAVDSGVFKDEIVPVIVKKRKEEIVFDTDEFPNRNTTREKLATLRPAFKKDGGTVTAGNSSGINDGASFVMLASEEACEKYNLKPLVEVVAVGQGGVDPQTMGLGPVPAVENVLKHANLKIEDLDILELNEAFAAQSLGVVRELSEDLGVTEASILEKTNINGGAIALGHPVGASGNRILVTLIYELLHSDKKLGLASLCIGGGMGTAVIVKKVN